MKQIGLVFHSDVGKSYFSLPSYVQSIKQHVQLKYNLHLHILLLKRLLEMPYVLQHTHLHDWFVLYTMAFKGTTNRIKYSLYEHTSSLKRTMWYYPWWNTIRGNLVFYLSTKYVCYLLLVHKNLPYCTLALGTGTKNMRLKCIANTWCAFVVLITFSKYHTHTHTKTFINSPSYATDCPKTHLFCLNLWPSFAMEKIPSGLFVQMSGIIDTNCINPIAIRRGVALKRLLPEKSWLLLLFLIILSTIRINIAPCRISSCMFEKIK